MTATALGWHVIANLVSVLVVYLLWRGWMHVSTWYDNWRWERMLRVLDAPAESEIPRCKCARCSEVDSGHHLGYCLFCLAAGCAFNDPENARASLRDFLDMGRSGEAKKPEEPQR